MNRMGPTVTFQHRLPGSDRFDETLRESEEIVHSAAEAFRDLFPEGEQPLNISARYTIFQCALRIFASTCPREAAKCLRAWADLVEVDGKKDPTKHQYRQDRMMRASEAMIEKAIQVIVAMGEADNVRKS